MNPFWKRCVGLVTDLHNKYKRDDFLRAEVNVVVLQILFAVVLSVIVSVSFNYLYRDILETIIQGITESIRNNGNITGEDILNSTEVSKSKNFLSFLGITAIITLIFSYVIIKIALIPARNALQAQKRFSKNVAHELRTPLSIIKTNTEVALLDEKLPSDFKEVFKSTNEEVDRASSIINNLLNINNLITLEQIKSEKVNLVKIVETAILKLSKLAKKKHIKISLKKNGASIIWGNSTALEQIALNIIKNAITYTPFGGSISISIKLDNNYVALSVMDNGVGISEKDMHHIFEPFYRVEESRNRKTGGHGLGLSIVNELVKLHAGKISVKSRVNEGTTIVVFLPKERRKKPR